MNDLSNNADSMPRVMLFFVAVLVKVIASTLSTVAFVLRDAALSVSGLAGWIAWFCLLFLVAAPGTDRWLRGHVHWLKPAALAIFVVLLVAGVLVAIPASSPDITDGLLPEGSISELLGDLNDAYGYNDGTALCHQATENFVSGENPYATANIVSATLKFGGDSLKLTPLCAGRFADQFPYPSEERLEQVWQEASRRPETVPPELESRLNYPAGCFILSAPLMMLGVDDLRLIYLIFLVPALVCSVWLIPGKRWLLFLGALLISLELWNGLAVGETGFLVFPFLLIAWLAMRKNLWLSAVLMGVAIAVKQTGWFFVPFYLILIYRTMDRRKVIPVTGILAGVFLAFNLPFIISDPGLWLSSVTAPMTDSFFPMGAGIVSLVNVGVLDIRSPLVFTAMELAVMIAAILWYLRYSPLYPIAGPVLAVVPLFFAWRSLWPYFFYVDIIVLGLILTGDYERELATAPVAPQTNRRNSQ